MKHQTLSSPIATEEGHEGAAKEDGGDDGSKSQQDKSKGKRVRRRKKSKRGRSSGGGITCDQDKMDVAAAVPKGEDVEMMDAPVNVPVAPLPPATAAAAGGGGGGQRAKVTIDHLPDVALLRIMEMLGTPRRQTYGYLDSAFTFFMSGLTLMTGVCRRWNRVIRHSGIWKDVCEWRWPWLRMCGEDMVKSLTAEDMTASYAGCMNKRGPPVYMDMCLQMGRCLRKAGVTRRDPDLGRDYMIMVEVYGKMGGGRMLSQTGPLSVVPVAEDEEEEKMEWRLLCSGYGPDSRVSRWPVGGSGRAGVLAAVRGTKINVEVVLVDKKTKKKAVLFYREAASCVLEHADESFVRDPVGRKLTLAGTDIFFDFKTELSVLDQGNPPFVKMALSVSTPLGVCVGDFHRLFQSSLHWV